MFLRCWVWNRLAVITTTRPWAAPYPSTSELNIYYRTLLTMHCSCHSSYYFHRFSSFPLFPSPHSLLSLLSRLELLPGFITSILQYEKSVMLCADISHKILRMDTVLDLFYDISQSARDVHEACTRSIVGEIVLTRWVGNLINNVSFIN